MHNGTLQRAEGSIQSPKITHSTVSFQVLIENKCLYVFTRLRSPFRVWFLEEKETAAHLGCDINAKWPVIPVLGVFMTVLVSNPRLGCFGEIDSRGYGTHLNGTDPPPPPRRMTLRISHLEIRGHGFLTKSVFWKNARYIVWQFLAFKTSMTIDWKDKT